MRECTRDRAVSDSGAFAGHFLGFVIIPESMLIPHDATSTHVIPKPR
jgi:hypothetical protein